MKVLAITASNTWGLALLVLLFGYGLVEVPRLCWNMSKQGYSLSRTYFKIAKMSLERIEAEEALEDALSVSKNAFSVLWSGSIVYIWHCYFSHTSTRPCPPTFGEKQRLQHSICALWIRSAFVLGVCTWCLEQSASSAERHRSCLHLQVSLKFMNSSFKPTAFRRLLQPLLIPKIVCITDWCFFSLTICVLSSFLTLFLVSLGLYVDIYIFTVLSAIVHVL